MFLMQFGSKQSRKVVFPKPICPTFRIFNGTPLLLTDDMAVRSAARQFHIVPVGSLGIVVSAFKRREISLEEAEHYIADLYDVSSLFVTRSIVELAIEQLRSSAK